MNIRRSWGALAGVVVLMGTAAEAAAGSRSERLDFRGDAEAAVGGPDGSLQQSDQFEVSWSRSEASGDTVGLFGTADADLRADRTRASSLVNGSFLITDSTFDGRVVASMRGQLGGQDDEAVTEFFFSGRYDFTIDESTPFSGIDLQASISRLSAFDAQWEAAIRFVGAEFDFELRHDETSPDEITAGFRDDLGPGNYSIIFEGNGFAAAEWQFGAVSGAGLDALGMEFSVNTLPSPGAGAIFAMAGLTAARRRRLVHS